LKILTVLTSHGQLGNTRASDRFHEMKPSHVVPFLVEDELLRLGAIFEKKADWQTFTITDGGLIIRQNPASSTGTARSAFEAGRAKAAA